jgi:hypothetical protein
VRVVHAEDPHPVLDPVQHHPQRLGVDPGRVVVEVDRVDVLVLLRRVLRVRDRAVGADGEPLGVLGHPRVVGGALQREVERDLHPEVPGAVDERVEVVDGAELRLDGVVATVGRTDRPRRADVAGTGVDVVVAALAVHSADGVDRRQVDDVEAHRGDAVELLRGGDERAVDRAALLVDAAGGAREELVPGAEQGPLPVDVDLLRASARDELPHRPLGHDPLDGREQGGRHARVQRERGVAQRVGGAEEQVAVRTLARTAAHPLQQPGAHFEVVGQLLGALPGRQLDGDGVPPGGPRVAPGVDAEAPQARLVGHDGGGEPVGAGADRCHAHVMRGALAADPAPDDVGRDRVVALPPHGGRDRDDLADDRLARMTPVAHGGSDVIDPEPTGHRHTPC